MRVLMCMPVRALQQFKFMCVCLCVDPYMCVYICMCTCQRHLCTVALCAGVYSALCAAMRPCVCAALSSPSQSFSPTHTH